MSYRVELSGQARKDLRRLPPVARGRLLRYIAGLAEQPRPRGIIKLAGRRPPQYRLRAGEYRVTYVVGDEVKAVHILRVLRRTTTTYDV